jgi:hypothetical protein
MHALLNWASQHPGKLIAYAGIASHVLAAAIDTLPMPDSTSGKFYRWFFGFANVIVANYSRTKASTGPIGQLPPKGN